jgi:hypothetical protein
MDARASYKRFAEGKLGVLLLADAASTGPPLGGATHVVIWEPQLNREVPRQLMKRTSQAGREPHVVELVWGRPKTELTAGMGETVDEGSARLAALREERVRAFHQGLSLATQGGEDHTHPMWTSDGSSSTSEHGVTSQQGVTHKQLVYLEEKITPVGTYSDGKSPCQPWGNPIKKTENVKRSFSLADIMARKRP